MHSLSLSFLLTICVAAVASEVKTSLAPIRAIQHRDNQGNPIGVFDPYLQLNTTILI
jgi:hypothetical protein